MNRFTLAVALFAVALWSTGVQAQSRDTGAVARTPTLFVVPHLGYNGLALGEVKALHAEVVQTYRRAGLDLPTQQTLGGDLLVGADVLLAAAPSKHYGVGLRYTRSRSYSLYGDYAGTLDVVSSVHAVLLEAVSQHEFGGVVLGSRGGLVYGRMSTRESLELEDFGGASSEIRGGGFGYSIEGFGGVRILSAPFPLYVRVGYRYAKVDELQGSVRVDGVDSGSGTLPIELNLSGFVGTIAVPLGVR